MTTVSIDKPSVEIGSLARGDGGARRAGGRLVVPPRRYKVGELVAATGLSRQTLHNYTKWGLIGEAGWTAGGHRLYDETVFARLERVMQLKAEHTVQKVRELLELEDAKEQAA